MPSEAHIRQERDDAVAEIVAIEQRLAQWQGRQPRNAQQLRAAWLTEGRAKLLEFDLWSQVRNLLAHEQSYNL